MYDGLILIDKPKGWTSFDVVAKIRNILKKEVGHKIKVGHTGTLDPLATGLMVMVVGTYCKRAGEFSKLDKTYEVTMKLGQTSSTGDDEGEKTIVSEKEPDLEELKAVCDEFVGEIMQTPPAFSAIKVNGQRAYKLAREGKEVKLEARKVTIHGLEITDYKYPIVKFTVKVSSGTYIRSLVDDIGKKLKIGAYMRDLERTKVSDFILKDAIIMDKINFDKITKNMYKFHDYGS